MSLWNHLPVDELQPDDESRRLIDVSTRGTFAGPVWTRTLLAIRELEETEETR